MIRFVGNDPFKPVFEKAGVACRDVEASWLLNDEAQAEDWLAGKTLPEPLRLMLQERDRLRGFGLEKTLPMPTGKQCTTFDQASQWMIAHDRFPLAIKSCRNRGNGQGIYRLEGFRELSRFYDRLQTNFPGPVWVEDWIKFDAIIEITRAPQGTLLVSQVGLEKRLAVKHSWRQFPVTVPARLKDAIQKLLDPFSDLVQSGIGPIRFSLALAGNEAFLISVNAGMNRLEYLPEWASPFGLWPVLFWNREKSGDQKKTFKFGRLQLFYRTSRDGPFPKDLPKVVGSLPILKYAVGEKVAAVLLGGDEPASFSPHVRTLSNILAGADTSD